MAITAIAMHLRQLVLVIGLISTALMLMAVMAEVLRRCILLMLTIDGRRRPGELERQHQQHQNDQQFFHGANLNIEISVCTR